MDQVPRRQHLISQVLLRRFTDPQTKQLTARNLPYGSESDKTTRSVGFETNFVSHEPKKIEELWQTVEDSLPDAFAAVDDGTVFDNPEAQSTLLDCLALHFIRSKVTRTKLYEIADQTVGELRAKLLAEQRGLLVREYRKHHSGQFPPSNDELLAFVDEVYLGPAHHDRVQSGEYIHERLTITFKKARDLFARWGLQIARPADGTEFILGDQPGLRVQYDKQQYVGLFQGAVGDAATFVLPVGPDHLAGSGPTPGWKNLTPESVIAYNALQVHAAEQWAYLRPGCDFGAATGS